MTGMTLRTTPSVLVVGGGIVGLCIAALSRLRGWEATVIDPGTPSASRVAAGMIAPALESLNHSDPALSFERLSQAAERWSLFHGLAPGANQPVSCYYIPDDSDRAADLFSKMGAHVDRIGHEFVVRTERLVDADEVMRALGQGVTVLRTRAVGVGGDHVTTEDGGVLRADQVVIAGGYESVALSQFVPSLGCLMPIKGHILDAEISADVPGITRNSAGYCVRTAAGRLRVGATMQAGQADLAVEADRVAALRATAEGLGVDMSGATALTGVRAATPDGWPLIGQDAASGVWVATGMRRNGYVFAPFAASVLVTAWQGSAIPEAQAYDPNRFLSPR